MPSSKRRSWIVCPVCDKRFLLADCEITARRKSNRNGMIYCSQSCSARAQKNLGKKWGVTPPQNEQTKTVHVKFHGLIIGDLK